MDALAAIGEEFAGIPGFMDGASRFVDLIRKEREGVLNDAEVRELIRQRDAAKARLDEIIALVSDIPDAVRVALRYRRDTTLYAGEVALAYLQGQATEGQLIEAYRDKGYVNRASLLGVVPGVIFLRSAVRRGGLTRWPDGDELRGFLRQRLDSIRFRPIGRDWPSVSIPDLRWGGPIRQQGGPWEDFMTVKLGDGYVRLHHNFKTFDHRSRDRSLAVSDKTLNTNALSYQMRPTSIYSRLTRYIDQIDRFELYNLAKDNLQPTTIKLRSMELAIPHDATSEQLFQIQRSIGYAQDLNIDLNVTRIRN